MQENTVFQNTPETEGLGQVSSSHSSSSHPPPFSMSVGTIARVFLGIIIVLIIYFLVSRVILPYFQRNNNQKITLTYWGLWEDSNIVKPIIDDFERQNPNITINYTKQDIRQYREKLSTRIQNGTGPDIFRFHNTWLPMLSSILLPLPSDTITKTDFANWFYPVAQRDLIRNGAIYGIPLEIDTLSLFINTQLFQSAGLKPPANWVDFANDARQMTVKDANGKILTAGAALGTFDNVTHAPDIISLLFAQNGADTKNLSGSLKNASDALTFYTSFASGDQKVWDDTLDPSMLFFSKGNLAMYFGYSWDYFAIKALAPSLSFQIVSVPHLPGRNMTIASYWAEGVSAKSLHKKEALLFMKFLARRTTEEKLFSEEAKTRFFGEPYARIDLSDKLKDNVIVYPFMSQAKDSVSSFFTSDTHDDGLNSQMNAYLGNAVRSILNGTSAQSATDTLQKGVSQVLRQYGD